MAAHTTPQPGQEGPAPWPPDLALIRLTAGANLMVNNASGPRYTGVSMVGYGLFGMLIMLCMLLWRLLKPAVSPWVSIGVIAAIVSAACVVLVVRRVARRAALLAGATPTRLYDPFNTDARVRYACHDAAAHELRRTPPDTGASFEPEVARVPMAMGWTRRDRWLAVIGGILGALAAVVALRTFSAAGLGGFAGLHLYLWIVIGGASTGAIGLAETLFPTWVRIMPGRVDVVRESLLGRRLIEVRKFDLRARSVVLFRSTLYLDLPTVPVRDRARDTGPKPVTIQFALTTRRKELIRAVLLAALTSAPTPVVSDEELYA
jgi:hypothetical protein